MSFHLVSVTHKEYIRAHIYIGQVAGRLMIFHSSLSRFRSFCLTHFAFSTSKPLSADTYSFKLEFSAQQAVKQSGPPQVTARVTTRNKSPGAPSAMHSSATRYLLLVHLVFK